jgi:hypothetical protein
MKHFLLAFAFFCIAGCQATASAGEGDLSGKVISVYQMARDAQAVQAGNFGASPIALVRESELKAVGAANTQSPGVVPVETVSGKHGWVVNSELFPTPANVQ